MTTNDKVIRPKRTKPKSRPQRWADAASNLKNVIGKLSGVFDEIETALSALQDIKSEYEEWKDNLPDSLQSSALGEKLEMISDFDFEQDPRDLSIDDLESLADEAKAADLPRGFGRD